LDAFLFKKKPVEEPAVEAVPKVEDKNENTQFETDTIDQSVAESPVEIEDTPEK